MSPARSSAAGETPAVSVVMPVRDAARFLDESVASVLGQTFAEFELVVLENGSRDRSRAILQRWAARDPRIRVHECGRPLGLVGSSNSVVEKASAPLVARMDADDVMHPERLERQVAVMTAHPDAVAVGSLSDGIDARGRRVLPRNRWRLIRCPQAPFPHGSTMFRREVFERVGGYRPGLSSRDIDLLLRLRDEGRVLVLPEALYRYRFNSASSTLGFSTLEIARSIQMLDRSFAERRGELDAPAPGGEPQGDRPPPRWIAAALHAQGALRLWAGGSPQVLRELVRCGPRLERGWVETFVWAAWGALSPGTLRASMRLAVRAKDGLAGLRIRDGRAYEWRLA